MAVTTGAIIGVATGAASAIKSFSEAAKQRKAADKARAESKRLMDNARKNAQKNFYAGLNVPLDAFGQQYEQNMALQQQQIESLATGDARNLAAGIGGVGAVAAAGTEKTRIGMQSDLYSNAVMKADAREGINARLIGMDVDQSKDESQREKDMLEARAKSMKSGFKGVGQFASSVGYLQPLFGGKAITQLEQEQLDTLAKANTGIWGDNSGS
jgi:hypothetical protein